MSVVKTCSAGSCHQPGFLPVTTDCPVLQVTPFSRWERELPKLVGDSRYKAIDKPKERRQIFDDFCRNVAEEQRLSKQRKDQQAAAAEPAFLALLNEAQAMAHEIQLPQSPAGLFAACLLSTCSLKEDGYCNYLSSTKNADECQLCWSRAGQGGFRFECCLCAISGKQHVCASLVPPGLAWVLQNSLS